MHGELTVGPGLSQALLAQCYLHIKVSLTSDQTAGCLQVTQNTDCGEVWRGERPLLHCPILP